MGLGGGIVYDMCEVFIVRGFFYTIFTTGYVLCRCSASGEPARLWHLQGRNVVPGRNVIIMRLNSAVMHFGGGIS